MSTELQQLYADLNKNSVRVSRPNRFVFLCGGVVAAQPRAKSHSLRDYLYRVRGLSKRFDITLAERATQLYRDTGYSDLISFEEDIARIAALVVVIAESPGSLAELGAFAANPTIKKNLRIIIKSEYHGAESFIRFGPIEHLMNINSDYVAFYPWRTEKSGRLIVHSIRSEVREISRFIRSELDSLPKTLPLNSLGESREFYIIYWIVFLAYAASTAKLYAYIRSILPAMSDQQIKDKLYCMELAGWITKTPYGNKVYFYSRSDVDPFEKYSFNRGVVDIDTGRRKYQVGQSLIEILPGRVKRTVAQSRRRVP